MKTNSLLVATIGFALLAAWLVWWGSNAKPTAAQSAQSEPVEPAPRVGSLAPAPIAASRSAANPPVHDATAPRALRIPTQSPALTKIERLSQIRANFTALAAGDAKSGLASARQITDEGEREVALLALVTAWRQGDLRPPRQRAASIAAYGLEAGLGMELVQDPTLALTWANELTDAKGRSALLQGVAIEQLNTDPTAALALADQVAPDSRRQFLDAVLGSWAGKDTDAALSWAQQQSDPAEHNAALQAIRNVAPVGIGTQLSMEDGQAVIGALLPGTPAALSGQIHPGDRIVAVAQGDGRFVDTGNVSLSDLVGMIRGSPGTLVQLQILPANAPAGSLPLTVPIIRDQIRHKQ